MSTTPVHPLYLSPDLQAIAEYLINMMEVKQAANTPLPPDPEEELPMPGTSAIDKLLAKENKLPLLMVLTLLLPRHVSTSVV